MGIGMPELVIILCVFFLVVPGTGFWIWMLIDCATKEPDTGNTKVVWILIIVLTHLIGAAIYYFVRRPERQRQLEGA